MLLVNYSRPLRDLGRLDESARTAERAYAKAREAGYEVVVNQSLLSRVATYRLQHHLDAADATLGEVEPRLRAALPPGHVAFVSIASEHALIAQARGDSSAALAAMNEAVALVETAIKTGGQGSEILPMVLMRRSAIEFDLAELDAAATDARRSIELLKARMPADIHSSHLGRAYTALAHVLAKQGDVAGARAALQTALEHLDDAAGPDPPMTRDARELLTSLDASASAATK
jgi:tetratricopeptide (TPR) repeat protein